MKVKFRPAPMVQSCTHPSVQDFLRVHGQDLISGRWPRHTLEVDGERRDWREYIPYGALRIIEENAR